jgi:hypothetical protein
MGFLRWGWLLVSSCMRFMIYACRRVGCDFPSCFRHSSELLFRYEAISDEFMPKIVKIVTQSGKERAEEEKFVFKRGNEAGKMMEEKCFPPRSPPRSASSDIEVRVIMRKFVSLYGKVPDLCMT